MAYIQKASNMSLHSSMCILEHAVAYTFHTSTAGWSQSQLTKQGMPNWEARLSLHIHM